MAFTRLDTDLNVIAKLPDEPNDEGGLTAAALKAKFDEAGLALQAHVNNALISELESTEEDASGASNVGFAPSAGVDEANVQAAIENVQAQLAGISQGAVPDGSITTAKLDDGAATGDKIAAGAVGASHLAGDISPARFYGKYSQMSGGAEMTASGKITFSTEDNDDFSAIDLTAYNTRITIPVGITKVRFYGYFSARNAAVRLYKNNSALLYLLLAVRAWDEGPPPRVAGTFFTYPIAVSAGDHFEIYAGASVNDNVAAGSVFGMEVLG